VAVSFFTPTPHQTLLGEELLNEWGIWGKQDNFLMTLRRRKSE